MSTIKSLVFLSLMLGLYLTIGYMYYRTCRNEILARSRSVQGKTEPDKINRLEKLGLAVCKIIIIIMVAITLVFVFYLFLLFSY